MRGVLLVKPIKILLLVAFLLGVLSMLSPAAEPSGRSPGPATKIRLATPVASLSYLPIHVALRKGFFAERGLEMEQAIVQLGGR